MSLEPDNPYASPEATDAALPPGPMPGSVKLAIGCLLVFGVVVAVNFVRWFPEFGESTAFLGFHLGPLLLIAGSAEGMRRRNAIAGAAALVFSAVCAAVFSIVAAGAVATIVAERWWGIGIHDTEINGVAVPTDTGSPSYWAATAVLTAVAVLLGTACFALMTGASRRYFQTALPAKRSDPQ